jgi:pimeloyl-ACP methyl ester carboxylesterase
LALGVGPEEVFSGDSQAGWIIPLALVKAPEAQFGVVLVGPVVSVGLENAYSDLAEGTDLPLEEVYRRFDPSDDPGGFDPLPVLARVRQPVLWLMGEDDRSVPTRTSVGNMEALIERGGRFTLEVFPRGTHGLRDSGSGRPMDFWGEIDSWLEVEELVEP